MVSNARDDLPDPEMPVKTMSRSRGRSRSTFLRLCSRAPRMVRCGVVSGTGPAYRPRPVTERMFDRSAGGFQLAAELGDVVAQPGGFLEAELLGGFVHLLLE